VTDSISITGIDVFARHGVLEHEQEEGQVFSVDVSLDLDLSQACVTDDVVDTVDYGDLARRVHDRVASERWDLIEKVAQRVADLVLEDGRVRSVRVTVHKPEAPIPTPFRDVSVTITRAR
jgi:dihydroneopterin aldolase